jgi:hypothetical protein
MLTTRPSHNPTSLHITKTAKSYSQDLRIPVFQRLFAFKLLLAIHLLDLSWTGTFAPLEQIEERNRRFGGAFFSLQGGQIIFSFLVAFAPPFFVDFLPTPLARFTGSGL